MSEAAASPSAADRSAAHAAPDAAAAGADEPFAGADPLERLLEVQGLDTEMGQLRHRRATLALHEDLAAAQAEQARRQQAIDEVAARRARALVRQKRLEVEAGVLEASGDAKDARLYSGEIRGIRDLEVLQSEIEGLRSRQSALEDQAIEALILIDDLSGEADALEAERSSAAERATILEAELAAVEAEIDERAAAAAAARDSAAAALDPEVLARYVRLRERFGHSTAVSFDPVRGCDCPSLMPMAEISRMSRCEPGSVLDCAECGRLVLR